MKTETAEYLKNAGCLSQAAIPFLGVTYVIFSAEKLVNGQGFLYQKIFRNDLFSVGNFGKIHMQTLFLAVFFRFEAETQLFVILR